MWEGISPFNHRVQNSRLVGFFLNTKYFTLFAWFQKQVWYNSFPRFSTGVVFFLLPLRFFKIFLISFFFSCHLDMICLGTDLLMGFCSGGCDSLHLPLSPILGAAVCPVTSNLRQVVHACSFNSRVTNPWLCPKQKFYYSPVITKKDYTKTAAVMYINYTL